MNLNKIFKDNLYKSSIYLILNSLITAGLGFFFWMIIARLFSSNSIGLATTIISVVGLISGLSLFGFNVGLMKYLPKNGKKKELVGSCFILSLIFGLILSIVYYFLIGVVSPKLIFVKKYYFTLVVFVLFWILFTLGNSVLVGLRKSNIVMFKGLIFSILKLGLPFVLVSFGIYGILGSWYLSALFGVLFSLFFIPFSFKIDFSLVRKMFRFNFGNYIASVFGMLPSLLLPVLITQLLEPRFTAYFYVSWTIGSLLFIIPSAVSQSFLTEGSYNGNGIKERLKKSFKFSFALLIIGILFFVLFGEFLLSLFGKEYMNSYIFLVILCLSSLIYCVNQINISFFNVRNEIWKVVLVNFLIALFTILGSYYFINYGLVGIGLSWVIGNLVGVVVGWLK